MPHILDLRRFDCECVYYPCRASGLGRSLDTDRVVHEHPRIVGCEVSREIFLANNPGKDFEFVNICPLHSQEAAFDAKGAFHHPLLPLREARPGQQERAAGHGSALGRRALEDSGGGKMSGAGSKKVAVVAGDGIGPEVVESALAVLDAAGAKFERVSVEIGLSRWKRTGVAMGEEDLQTLKECDCILFGAISTPHRSQL